MAVGAEAGAGAHLRTCGSNRAVVCHWWVNAVGLLEAREEAASTIWVKWWNVYRTGMPKEHAELGNRETP